MVYGYPLGILETLHKLKRKPVCMPALLKPDPSPTTRSCNLLLDKGFQFGQVYTPLTMTLSSCNPMSE